MLEQLFENLTRAVEGSPATALSVAFVWGVLSILLSPCHLSSIPLIVGFLNRQEGLTTRRAAGVSALFASGILVSIAAIGAATVAAGRMMGDLGPYANYFVAGVFFLVGLHMLDVIPAPWSGPGLTPSHRRGPLAALVLGLIFGLAVGPCTFAYMAPMLAVAFRASGARMLYGAALLLLYGVGHCSVIVLAGGSTGLVQRYLNWNERSGGVTMMRRACGALVIVGGLYLVYTAR